LLGLQADTVTVDVTHRRISVAIDGEVAMLAPPLVYRIRPRALEVIVAEAPA
jgi:diacylglycerol kinase family enzyme